MKPQVFLPLVTYPQANADAVVAQAVALASALDADLQATAFAADFPTVASPLGRVLLNVPEMIREAEAKSRARCAALLRLVEESGAAAGVSISTSILSAPVGDLDRVAAEARLFDLTAVGWERDNQTTAMTAEALVFGSGRPVVLLPQAPDPGGVEAVAIAWDGSGVAARAAFDAMPFLARAKRVAVLTVTDEKPMERDVGPRFAEALKRRGLPAEALAVPAQDGPVSDTLQEEALRWGAKLLVMGGYGHSRLRDFVLGGATKGILSDLRLPVLLSH
ncbi:MAG TPA: universal stress protein [Mesorhizobium sp.]|jgi:nucleotide-binding universal stress UspA family protein|nr:universal stress protein [Mesorhizobium sp.]